MSVKSQVLSLLKCKEWVSTGDFDTAFPKKTPGHLSWWKRMSELRKKGYVITCRHVPGTEATSEWKLESEPKQQPTIKLEGQQFVMV